MFGADAPSVQMNDQDQYDWVANLLFVSAGDVGSYRGGVAPPRNTTMSIYEVWPQWDNANRKQIPGVFNATRLSLIDAWTQGSGVMDKFPYFVSQNTIPGPWNNYGQPGNGGPCNPCMPNQYNVLVSPNLRLANTADDVDDALFAAQSGVQHGRFQRFAKGNNSVYRIVNELFPSGAFVFRKFDSATHVLEFDMQSYFAYVGNQHDFPFVGLQQDGNPSWCPVDQRAPTYNGDQCGTGVTVVQPQINMNEAGVGDMNRYLTGISTALLRSATGDLTKSVRMGVRPMPFTFTPRNQQDYVRLRGEQCV